MSDCLQLSVFSDTSLAFTDKKLQKPVHIINLARAERFELSSYGFGDRYFTIKLSSQNVAPRDGLEPPTLRLTVCCTAYCAIRE